MDRLYNKISKDYKGRSLSAVETLASVDLIPESSRNVPAEYPFLEGRITKAEGRIREEELYVTKEQTGLEDYVKIEDIIGYVRTATKMAYITVDSWDRELLISDDVTLCVGDRVRIYYEEKANKHLTRSLESLAAAESRRAGKSTLSLSASKTEHLKYREVKGYQLLTEDGTVKRQVVIGSDAVFEKPLE